ncbi:acetyl-CoA carboxylase, carboxyltransferase subunit beta [Pseudonocardia endophytica]|uniref:Multifunctional fusion protein n=1 Tax=Pseudonocardia endophytica TaxID=401976 RepID=A0A4R1HIL0_PSEEN|nr:acetyl-CoA carboxylase, carboxyltransferase subunit beta [Pseudonocardia endophytica]TCK22087.1 acetyl-CoA carboxylase carboxyl transferase subunit beta [Pseudonocardia endophytica]
MSIALDTRSEHGHADWSLCPSCGGVLYGRRLARDLLVCPDCGHHHRLTARQRLDQLLDPGSAEMLDVSASSRDVLEFTDTAPYPERLERARLHTGLDEGVLVASGRICDRPLIVAAMDFRFLGGSLGAAVGEAVTLAAEAALRRSVPLLLVSASGGARMQEGAIALMQMAKTSAALGRLDEAGVPTIALVTDPTYGGVAASFATLCDVIVAEPGARLGFAGRRVIEQTIRQELPDGFQSAEMLLEQGMIDAIRPRSELRATLGRLLAAGDPPPVSDDHPTAAPDVVRDPSALPAVDAWHAVQQARDLDRPTTLDYLAGAFEDFEELRGDRVGGDCSAIVAGPARLGGQPVMVIGHQKGHSLAELTARNFGMGNPSGYRKSARLMRLAAKWGLPVLTLVDTPGAFPGPDAEERGQAVAIAENIRLMSALRVPVLSMVIGEGGSGGALALAVADEVLISERAVYSVISPEGCAAILWDDPSMAPTAAGALKLDARSLLELGVVDGVVREAPSGTSTAERVGRVAPVLAAHLRRLAAQDPDRLVRRRRARFRAFGRPGPDFPNPRRATA